MKTGEKIRHLREIRRITPEKIADELGMSVSGYRKIERGNVKLTTEKLETIAKYLGVEPKELLDSEGIVFNINNDKHSNNGYNIYNFPKELKSLYEDKIKLQEDKIKLLEEKIRSMAERNS